MTATTLVTGAAGFVGSWLVPALVERGARVVGARKPGLPCPDLPCEWLDADLRDADAVRGMLRRVQPAQIVHLAGLAAPRDAARDPLENQRLNYHAVDHLLGAMADTARGARLLLVSSGEVYGRREAGAPRARESDALLPPNAYAAAKAAAEQRGVLAAQQGLEVVRVRPFNHTGPGRPDGYAESSFAKQIARIERGDCAPLLRVGNLTPIRDFSDVRDVVAAYALLLERGVRGEVYNICSGRGRTVRSLVERLLRASRTETRIDVDPERYQPAPPGEIASVGDPGRLQRLGWQPEHEFDDTLVELLDYWRERV